MAASRHKVAVSPTPRQAESGWALEAIFSNGARKSITGFTSESEASAWFGSTDHLNWLRANRAQAVIGAQAADLLIRSLNASVVIFTSLAAILAQKALRMRSKVQAAHARHKLEKLTRLYPPMRRLFGATTIFHSLDLLTVCRRHSIKIVPLLTVVVVILFLGRANSPPLQNLTNENRIDVRSQLENRGSVQAAPRVDGIGLLIDQLSLPERTTAELAVPSVEPDAAQPDNQGAAPRDEVEASNHPSFAGIWVADPDPCPFRKSRRVWPAVITARGARAGDTSCVFKTRKRIEQAWQVVANCSNRHDRWTANVLITVKGDRLTWASERGTQTYTRCRRNI
jgi:hypothetical protein